MPTSDVPLASTLASLAFLLTSSVPIRVDMLWMSRCLSAVIAPMLSPVAFRCMSLTVSVPATRLFTRLPLKANVSLAGLSYHVPMSLM